MNSQPTPVPIPYPTWARPFALATAAVYFISLIFPIAAGLSKNSAAFPKWWGALDVGWAFVLAIMAFVVYGLGHRKVNKQIEETTYRAYRILIHGIFVLMVVFLLFGDRITWSVGLLGVAWRAWLLLFTLPEWFAVVARGTSGS